MLHKRLIIVVLLIIWCLLNTGCWDRQEINQIGFAVGLGIDKEGEDYIVTTQMALPGLLEEGGGGGDEPPVWVIGGKGKTLFEAIRDVNTRSARKPFWGHLNVIVLGEKVARDGILPVLDLLSRGHEFRRLNYIVIAKGKARDILEAQPKLEKINAIFIRNLIKNRVGQSVAPEVTLHDLMITLSTAGKEPIISKIEAFYQESFLPPKQEKGKEAEKKKEILELRGAAIFKGDRFVSWIDEKATRGYLWATNGIGSGIVVVESPAQKGKEISLEIKNAESSISPKIEDEKIIVSIKVDTILNLSENMGILSIETERLLDELGQRANNVIKSEIEAAVKKAQENKTDIFGVGEIIRTQYPQVWKEIKWSETFPLVEIIINVNSKIEQTTMTLKPITPPTQREKE